MSKFTGVQGHSEAALPPEMGPFGQTLFPNTMAAHRVLPSVWGLGQQMVTAVSALLEKCDHFLKAR